MQEHKDTKELSWVGERIEKLMKERGIGSVKELSDMAGISNTTIHSIMKRQKQGPSLKTLNKLCKGLRITIDEFIKGTEIDECYTQEETNSSEINFNQFMQDLTEKEKEFCLYVSELPVKTKELIKKLEKISPGQLEAITCLVDSIVQEEK